MSARGRSRIVTQDSSDTPANDCEDAFPGIDLRPDDADDDVHRKGVDGREVAHHAGQIAERDARNSSASRRSARAESRRPLPTRRCWPDALALPSAAVEGIRLFVDGRLRASSVTKSSTISSRTAFSLSENGRPSTLTQQSDGRGRASMTAWRYRRASTGATESQKAPRSVFGVRSASVVRRSCRSSESRASAACGARAPPCASRTCRSILSTTMVDGGVHVLGVARHAPRSWLTVARQRSDVHPMCRWRSMENVTSAS